MKNNFRGLEHSKASHLNHPSCTLFAVMGHYKDSKNALMFLYHITWTTIGEQCQNLLKSFLISLLRYVQPLLCTDGTAQHFKKKYSLCHDFYG